MPRAPQFLLQRDAARRRRLPGDRHQRRLGARSRLGQGRRIVHVQPARAIDDHAADTGAADLVDLFLPRQQEAAAHERMVHPSAVEGMDEHSETEPGGIDFL
jgi:hypothetical protein